MKKFSHVSRTVLVNEVIMINVQITKEKQSNNGTKNNETELTTKIVS